MNNLRNLRLEYELNMKQVAEALSIPYTTYVSYEKGDREPNAEMLIRMADFYLTTVDYILNKSDAVKRNDIVSSAKSTAFTETDGIPLIKKAIGSADIYADENVESVIPAPQNVQTDFAVKAEDRSMSGARILPDDIVFIRNQETVENGEISALLIDNKIILRRFFRYGNTIVLRADNPDFKETVMSADEAESIKILGKAVYFFSRII